MPQRHKVLITGSSGMLGIDLSLELAGYYEVIGIDIVPSAQVHKSTRAQDTKFYTADISDREEITEIVEKTVPDIVIHTAAWTDVDGCELDKDKAYRINTEGTKNIALVCKVADIPLVYISTDFIFNGTKKGPYRESDKPDPVSVYGDSKLKGEEAVKNISEKYFILRTSWLYGRHGKNFVDTISAKTKTEKLLKVVDDQVGSPTYTKDLAKAIHILLDKIFEKEHKSTRAQVEEYGIYHVSNSGSVSWYEYAREIVKLAGSKARVMPISSKELARPAKRPAMSVLDNSKFQKYAGYRMQNWKDALKKYLSEEKS